MEDLLRAGAQPNEIQQNLQVSKSWVSELRALIQTFGTAIPPHREERPPWVAQDTPEQRRINAAHKSYIQDAQRAIEDEVVRKWEKRWK